MLTWRWCLYVNLLIAVPTAIVATRLLVNQALRNGRASTYQACCSQPPGCSGSCSASPTRRRTSWSAPATIASLAASAVLLTAFIAVERGVQNPLLPLHIVRDRARGGAYASIALAGSAVFAVFLFLTYYLQQDLGFSPLKTGLAFLPMTGMIMLTATTVQTKVLPARVRGRSSSPA